MNETIEMFQNIGGVISTNLSGGLTAVQPLAVKARPIADAAQNSFDGETFNPRQDSARLTGQLARVRDCMADGVWRTLDEIKAVTGDQTQAISARLRDLRKIRFGMHKVDRRRRGEPSLGIWEYRLENN